MERYEDEKNKEGNRKYGDFILWMQVIDKAKESKSPVIFITDERKKDWWWKIKDGRNMGPRQELTEEIMEKAKVDFHMYSSERFLSYGQNFLKEQVNQEALEEIQEMKKAELEHIRMLKRRAERDLRRRIRAKDEQHYLKQKQIELKENIYQIEVHQNSLMRDAMNNSDIQEYIHSLSIQKAEMENELNEINGRIESSLRKFSDKETMYRKFLKSRNDEDEKNN